MHDLYDTPLSLTAHRTRPRTNTDHRQPPPTTRQPPATTRQPPANHPATTQHPSHTNIDHLRDPSPTPATIRYVQPNVLFHVTPMFPAISGIRLSRDVRSLSEFRANAAAFVEQVQSTQEPIILTQRSRGAAVLLGIDAYESLVDEIELLRDLNASRDQAAAAERLDPRENVEARLRAVLGR
jgi:antitoxin YefM